MPLYAGVCETNITPPPDVWIGGQENMRRCAGVHDDLYARALVLDNGHKRIALIAADLMAGSEEWARSVRHAVADALHTEAGAVMLHCTHTRSGPRLPAVCGADKPDGAAMETLTRKIAGAARQAGDNLLPAGLTYGEASAQIGVARRLSGPDGSVLRTDNYGGPVSSLVQTLCVVGADGQTFALLFAHACPPDTMPNDNAHITADWPGAAVAHLKKRFGKEAADTGIASDALPFCLIGCGGDIAPVRRGSWEAVQTNGRIIADAAHTARWNAHGRLTETLDWTETTVALPLSPPPSIQEAEKMVKALLHDMKRADVSGDEVQRMLSTEQWGWACDMRHTAQSLAANKSDLADLHEPFTIQKLNLGGVTLLGFPAEMFVQYQQAFLTMSNTPVFCLNATNGNAGYMPTEAERERGGYEVDEAYKQHRALNFAPGCEALLHAAVRELLPANEYD